MNTLLTVSLRQRALYVPDSALTNAPAALSPNTLSLTANLAKLGYGVSEPLLHALNRTAPAFQADLLATFREVMGVGKNWTPLVKGWNVPTGEGHVDHLITWFVNLMAIPHTGPTLPCGHTIPHNTFPLERYMGCPFCGTPFAASKAIHYGQGSKLKVLDHWNEADLNQFYADLLGSKTALDATQTDSLKTLLGALPLPNGAVGMKETAMLVIDTLVACGKAEEAQPLFKSPTDVLRYLWYKHTGFLQVVAPKTAKKRFVQNHRHLTYSGMKSAKTELEKRAELRLHYGRKEALMAAKWLNGLPVSAEQAGELMHPKRGMWVRFIRALRLAEFSKRPGFEPLRELLDVFYHQHYEVWQGYVNHYRFRLDAANTLGLLKQRPGLFARSLFANILWFGPDETLAAFEEVVDQVPARLVFTLNSYAQVYFVPNSLRVVKPLGGVMKQIPTNGLLELYDEAQLASIRSRIEDLSLLVMRKRYAALPTTNRTVYIDPALFRLPVSIGDRAESVQDVPTALMGTRFSVEGDQVRLFMQWGVGLPAQHLDMDLSAYVAYDHRADYCSYSHLTTTGCQHSGDIRSIPEQVGTAEYINLNINELRAAKAKYVCFVCNAYSMGSLSPNLVVGWMNSRHRMTISERTGVAYDPSCVQHQVRITKGLTKGLVFGLLDIAAREIIWLEMPFQGQVVQQFDLPAVQTLLAKLNAKLSVGTLLTIKADAQGLQRVDVPEAADEAYTAQWATNAAAVTQLLAG
jgi:hypothetical protein